MAEVGQRVPPPPGLSVQQLDLLPTPCVGLDVAGRVTFWNRAAAQQFGPSTADALGRPAAELIAVGDDRQQLLDDLDALRSGVSFRQCNLHSELVHGQLARGSWTLLASTAEDGSFAGAMALCQSLVAAGASTDGAHVAPTPGGADPQASHAELYRQDALLDAIPDSLYVCRRDGLILEFRPGRGRDRRSPPPGGFVGRSVRESVDPEIAVTVMQMLADVADTGIPRTHEFAIRTANGSAFREARYARCGTDTILVLIRDIDAQHRAQAERERLLVSLDHERRQLDAVIQQLPAMLCIVDSDGLVRRVNHQFLEMLGVSAGDVLGRAQGSFPFTIVDETGRALTAPELPSVRALHGEYVATEVGVPLADGKLWLHVLAAPIRNETGDVEGAVLTMQDLTAERAAADALRASETTNRTLVETIPDSIYHVDRDGTILHFKAATGLTLPAHLPADLTGMSIDATLPPEIARERRAIVQDVLRTGLTQRHTYTLSWDGRETHREARVAKLDADSVLCLVRNIDPQVEGERERERLLSMVEADRRRLNAILRQVPNGLLVFDAQGRIVEVNDALAESLGRPKSEIIGDTAPARNPAYFAEDGHPLTPEEIPSARALRGIESTVLVYDDSPGRQVWLEVSAAPIRDEHGNIVGAIVDSRDVTAERAAAETLRASEAHNRALLNAIPDSIYRVRRDGTVLERRAPDDGRVRLNEVYAGRTLTDLVGPDVGGRLVREIARALETGRPQEFEYTWSGGGELLYREARAVALGPDEALLLVRDIGARRRAEMERERLLGLVDAERRRLDAVFRQAPNGLVVYDADGRIAEINDALANIMRRPKSEIVGQTAAEAGLFYHDESGRRLEPHELPSARALRGEDVNVVLCGGTAAHQVWIQVSAAPIRDEHGAVVGSMVASRNISTEREAAEALRASEAQNRALVDAIPDALYRVRPDGTILEHRTADNGQARLREVDTGQTLMGLVGPELGGRLVREVERAIASGRPQELEYTWSGGGESFYRESRTVALGPDEALLLVRDIGARRQAELEREQLLQRVDGQRRRLDVILRQLPYALVVLDRDGRVEEVNEGFLQSRGATKEQVVGRFWREVASGLHHLDGRRVSEEETPSAVALTGREYVGELLLVLPNGAKRWLHVAAAPILDEQGAVTGAIVATRNITVEREAIEALRASEERNRALLEAIPDTIYVGGRDSIIRDYKAPGDGRSMLPEVVIGRKAEELWPAAVVVPLMQVVNRALDSGETQVIDYLIPTAHGEAYREARVVPCGDEQVLVLVRDVDARRRAEQERERLLQQIDGQRRRLDAILRQVPNTLIVLDRTGRIQDVNEGFLVSLGLSRDDVIGRGSHDVGSVFRNPDGSLMKPDAMPSSVALAGQDYFGEMFIERPDGRHRWVHVSAGPIRDEHGAITGAIISTRNVTAEREAMAALQASEARIRALLDAIPDSIYVRDRDGTLLDYKPPGDGRPMQLRPKVGQPLSEMWTGTLGDEILQVTRKVIDTGEPQFMEYQVPTPAGPAYREARVVRSGPNQMLALVRDIDARKRAEQDLHLLNQQLEERVQARTAELEAANHELEAFSYSVSHDLKAPLRGIDGYSRLLWEDYQDRLDDDGRVLLQNVRQGAAQMYQLIDDLLAYSRLERRAVDQFEIELLPIVEGLLDERAGEIAARGVQVTVDVPNITVRADRDGLAQAVRNLLENALRFTDAADPPEIAIRAITHADCCILSVQDNGIGFDMAYHDRIFEIFQRLHRAEEYAGTGIGLALVRKAMQRMGGRVWAESAPGAGATFSLELPR